MIFSDVAWLAKFPYVRHIWVLRIDGLDLPIYVFLRHNKDHDLLYKLIGTNIKCNKNGYKIK